MHHTNKSPRGYVARKLVRKIFILQLYLQFLNYSEKQIPDPQ